MSDGAGEIARGVAASGTSFYWAMKFLPAPQRRAMFAIYAFCRAVDDVVDEPGESAAKAARLDQWRSEIARIYDGRPETPLGRALLDATTRFDLAREDFIAVIDGMAMDAGAPIRAPSLAELDLYCVRVAGAVGLLSVRVFGVHGQAGRRVAGALGRAFQLTNILRDLHEDAGLGRLYLPLELLARAGIESRDPASVLAHPNLPEICRELAVQARARFAEAEAAMADCPRRAMRPVRVMAAVYRRVLDRLEARGWRDLERPVRLSKPSKLLLALRYGLI